MSTSRAVRRRQGLMRQVQLTPPSFVAFAERACPALLTVSPFLRQRVAWMMHEIQYGRRRHKASRDASTFSAAVLTMLFGRGRFLKINAALVNPIVVSQSGHYTRRETREFHLAPALASALQDYRPPLVPEPLPSPVAAVKLRILRSAISPKARTRSRRTLSAWKGVKVPNAISLNMGALVALGEVLRRFASGLSSPAEIENLNNHGVNSAERAGAYLADVRALLDIAQSNAPAGHLDCHYHQTSTGRLSMEGVNLLNAPRIIRTAALHGCWDIDIENCHLTLLTQLASPVSDAAVSSYRDDTKGTRRRIAERTGIPESTVKKCANALMYGAVPAQSSRRPQDPERSIAKYLDNDEQKILSLRNDPEFGGLNAGVRKLVSAIIESWPLKAGRVINAMKLTIRPRPRCGSRGKSAGKPRSSVAAHILQGAEASILRAMARACEGSLLLCVHDGFVSRERIELGRLEDQIHAETGFRVELHQHELALPFLYPRIPTGRQDRLGQVVDLQRAVA